MSKYGPIVIIEDDQDDVEIFKTLVAALDMKNPVRNFSDTRSALDFLSATDEAVFLIFCDINLPRENGLEFKKKIDADPKLRKKSIPFVFMSTSATKETVDYAYEQLTVQGFFRKGNDLAGMQQMLSCIFAYWKCCIHPNSE